MQDASRCSFRVHLRPFRVFKSCGPRTLSCELIPTHLLTREQHAIVMLKHGRVSLGNDTPLPHPQTTSQAPPPTPPPPPTSWYLGPRQYLLGDNWAFKSVTTQLIPLQVVAASVMESNRWACSHGGCVLCRLKSGTASATVVALRPGNVLIMDPPLSFRAET